MNLDQHIPQQCMLALSFQDIPATLFLHASCWLVHPVSVLHFELFQDSQMADPELGSKGV